MRQAPRKRRGPGTLPGRMVLLWRAPSFSGGVGLACAVVPPAHPPTFLETGGHAVPPAGAAPPAPCWEDDDGVCSPGAAGRFLACPRVRGRREGLSRPQPRSLIVCVTAFSSPPALRRRGAITKALRGITSHYKAITSRYSAVREPLLVITRRYEPLLSWMAPKSLCLTAAVAPVPNLPRRVLPLGLFPQRSCHRGILYG